MTNTIINPVDWNGNLSGYYSVDVAGDLYDVQNARKSWSFSAQDNDTLRFEVRDGDQHWWDASVAHPTERSEIADRTVIPDGTPLHISYDFNIEPGAPNTAYFLVLGQLHQNDYPGAPALSPSFDIALKGERMQINIKYTDAAGNPASKELFLDTADFQRGHFYQMDIKAVFDPAGNGRLVVERDGTTIVDYSGPLGYAHQSGVYWKEGIYRHSNATETIAVTYKDLAIETGGKVAFPDSGNYIAPPSLTLTHITSAVSVSKVAAFSAAADAGTDGGRLATITGSAKAGTTVTILEGDRPVGSAQVDSQGHFTTQVGISGTGQHLLKAVATDANGHSSIGSTPLVVEVGTAAEFVSRIDALATEYGLGAVVLTDTSVLTLTSTTQLASILRNDAAVLEKIEGPFSFLITNAVSGQAYDRQDEVYSSTGIVLERLRYSGTKLVYDEHLGADGSRTLKTWKADSSDLNEFQNGRLVGYSRYDLADKLTFKQIYNADGSKEAHYFNAATGSETNYTLTAADKSRVDVQLGITGQAYTKQVSSFDTLGKLVAMQRLDAAGTTLFKRSWAADGSTETHNFNAAGKETSFTLLAADGGRTEGKLGILGQTYSAETLVYDKLGHLIERDRFDVSGHQLSVELLNQDGSRKVYSFDPASHSKNGYSLYAADKSHVDATFVPGKESLLLQTLSYDTTGKLAEKDLFDGKGHKISVETWGSDGSHKLLKIPVPGDFDAKTEVLAAGHVVARETPAYDPLTHKQTGYTLYFSDKFRFDANMAVQDKAYAEQYATYDASGKLAHMTRYYGDDAHTLAFSQTVNADGSSELHNYDTAGRESARQVTSADGSKDLFTFTYGSAAAKTPSSVYEEHRTAANEKVWVDVTNGDGSHKITAYAPGVTLASHDGVADSFFSAGGDTFIFNKGSGQDVINNFSASSGANHDVIAIDHAIVADFDHLSYRASGNDTVVVLSPTDTITLKNVALSAITHDDFFFF